MSRTLTSLIKEHLVFATGSRNTAEQQALLASITKGGETGEDFTDLMDWLEVRVMDECNEIKLPEKS